MRNPKDITVLIVDDEKDIRETMKLNMELDDFNVLIASGGHEAIQVLTNNYVDFIISDIRMPEGDGVSLLNYVKKYYQSIPHVVLVSGYSEITAAEVKDLGGIDLISKPPDINNLVLMIKKHCNCS